MNFVLAFVQSLPYTSDDVTTEADEYPRYPLETLYEDGGDCEDTSILFSSILRVINIDNCLAVIRNPGHMMVGVWGHDDYQGSSWSHDGKKYYCCETTGEGFRIGDLSPSLSSAKAILYNVGVDDPVSPPSNQPPTVSISATPTTGEAPLTVSFYCTAEDYEGYIASYHWDFRDGTSSSSQNPSHTFMSQGTYEVILTVTDNQGATAKESVIIEVLESTSYSLTPTDDAYVDSDRSNHNFNDEITLRVWYLEHTDRPNTEFISYIMFDLSEIPAGGTIKNAELNLYAFSIIKSAVVEIYKCNDTSWDESSITWNNAPTFSSTYEDKQSVGPEDQWYSWDITNYVQDSLSKGKITIVLRTRSYWGSVTFWSQEMDYDKKPNLEIEID